MRHTEKALRDARNASKTETERIDESLRLIRSGYTAEEAGRSLGLSPERIREAWAAWKDERNRRERAYRRSVGRYVAS